MNIKLIAKIEKEIVAGIVKSALDLGYMVDHHNGEDVTERAYPDERRAISVKKLMREIRQCDEELLVIRSTDKKYIGTFYLVYGNDGYDVICDHSANEAIETILKPVKKIIDQYEDAA